MKQPLAITHADIVTGDRTGTVRPDMTVLVSLSGSIARVAPSAEVEVPAGHRTIDARGLHLMPGLINAHAHLFSDGAPLSPSLRSPGTARALSLVLRSAPGRLWLAHRAKRNLLTELSSGVTTVRTLGDPGYEVVRVASEINRGDYVAPRVLASGPLMAVTGGHGAPLIAVVSDNPWDARKNVRTSLRNGVTAIKISATGGVTDARKVGEAGRPQMTEDEMRAICEEAHASGVLVAAHAQGTRGVLNALRAGVDTIEHGAAMDQESIDLYHDNPLSLYGTSALVPTLLACVPLVELDPQASGVTPVARANARLVLDGMLRGIRDALDNDVTIGMGTDASMPFSTHYDTWRELDLLVRRGGLTPARALHAATRANARILGVDGLTGAVEEGHSADMLLLDANPLEDIRTLAHPHTVIMRGAVVEHPRADHLDGMDALLDTL